MSPSIVDSTDVRVTPRGSGDVADPGADARRQRVQQEFDRDRTAVLANEHCRMIGRVAEHGLVLVLAAGARERLDRRLAAGAAHPAVLSAEAEGAKRGGALHGVDGGEERRGVHAVERRGGLAWGGNCSGHRLLRSRLRNRSPYSGVTESARETRHGIRRGTRRGAEALADVGPAGAGSDLPAVRQRSARL